MSKNDGGPAFPEFEHFYKDGVIETIKSRSGMSLRDYFAAAVLTNLLTDHERTDAIFKMKGDRTSAQAFSEYCYEISDAMLTCREHK